jgi:hypothetical protein
MHRVLLVIGLGLLAGAVLQAPPPLNAQVIDTIKPKVPTPPDTAKPRLGTRADTLRDSLFRVDSIRRERIRADSIKSPIAHAEDPAELQVGRRLYWPRDSLFATGALTVADLLERVAGVSTYRGGWLPPPQVGSYLGDVRRVRVFYDGFEEISIDPRTGGILDLTQINLWSAEDATIEQTADEIRVYLRSWRVRNTHAETRTDVSTGDQTTNLYRGFFGARLNNGGAFQFGAQQYGTTPPAQFGGSSDQVGIVVRAGWAKEKWSVDGFGTRVGRHRGEIIGESSFDVQGDSIPETSSTRTDAYFRVAYADPDADKAWAQVMTVASRYVYTGFRSSLTGIPTTPAESLLAIAPLDTSRYMAQYIATGGTVQGPFRASGTARAFVSGGQTIFAPAARASLTTERVSVSGYAEAKSADSIARADVTFQLQPLPFISLLGSVARSTNYRVNDVGLTTTYLRGEAGLRLHELWLIGGVVRRDSALLAPAREYDTSYIAQHAPGATGFEAAIRGKLWGPLGADIYGIRWNDSTGAYRAQYQTRSELYVRTNLANRFPTHDFGLMASIIHEYRSDVHFPSLISSQPSLGTGFRTLSLLLEIRVLSATVSWQFRNMLGERYSEIGGFIMPRQMNFYGVRWSFVD